MGVLENEIFGIYNFANAEVFLSYFSSCEPSASETGWYVPSQRSRRRNSRERAKKTRRMGKK
ncbi:MAG: hypothetical protein IJT33_06570 [Campylobacter sp.]|nr:hypothetical protein [Campylobacter sp.]MBQ7676102.1 hypothetical protein [Campylobacter sp.]